MPRGWFRYAVLTLPRSGVLKRDGGALLLNAPPGCAQFTPTRSSAGVTRHGAGCAPLRPGRLSILSSRWRPTTTPYLPPTTLEQHLRQQPQSSWPTPPSSHLTWCSRVTGRRCGCVAQCARSATPSAPRSRDTPWPTLTLLRTCQNSVRRTRDECGALECRRPAGAALLVPQGGAQDGSLAPDPRRCAAFAARVRG